MGMQCVYDPSTSLGAPVFPALWDPQPPCFSSVYPVRAFATPVTGPLPPQMGPGPPKSVIPTSTYAIHAYHTEISCEGCRQTCGRASACAEGRHATHGECPNRRMGESTKCGTLASSTWFPCTDIGCSTCSVSSEAFGMHTFGELGVRQLRGRMR